MSKMTTSLQGLMFLASHEGIVTSRYKDSKGIWTIGIGHTAAAGDPIPVNVTRTLTLDEVFEIFKRDVVKYESAVNRAIKVPLKQHQFDALVSFHFNTGGINKAQLTASINKGDYAKAASQFMGWVRPPEIKGRRTAEMNLFKTGAYPAPYALVYSSDIVTGKLKGGKSLNLVDFLLKKDLPKGDTPISEPNPTTPVVPEPSVPVVEIKDNPVVVEEVVIPTEPKQEIVVEVKQDPHQAEKQTFVNLGQVIASFFKAVFGSK